MKRLFVCILLGLFAGGMLFAQPGDGERDLRKVARRKAKVLAAGKWRTDEAGGLEEVMLRHCRELQEGGRRELVSDVMAHTSVKSLERAQEWGTDKASGIYAREAMGAFVEGMGEMSAENCFYGGYEGKVQREIGGVLRMSVALYREREGGGVEYRIFYVVDEADASGARVRAMERAMEESEFLREHSERVLELSRKELSVETEL